jgi:hypothetical protein
MQNCWKIIRALSGRWQESMLTGFEDYLLSREWWLG